MEREGKKIEGRIEQIDESQSEWMNERKIKNE